MLTMVEPFDVVKDIGSGLVSDGVTLRIDPFTLESSEEILHGALS